MAPQGKKEEHGMRMKGSTWTSLGLWPCESISSVRYSLTFTDDGSAKAGFTDRQIARILPASSISGSAQVEQDTGQDNSDNTVTQYPAGNLSPHTRINSMECAERFNLILLNMVQAWIRELKPEQALSGDLVAAAAYTHMILQISERVYRNCKGPIDHLRTIDPAAYLLRAGALQSTKLNKCAVNGILVGNDTAATYPTSGSPVLSTHPVSTCRMTQKLSSADTGAEANDAEHGEAAQSIEHHLTAWKVRG
ncbi:hypothetical protein K437DRAFT_261232 [Tilletiaria anomala UBC 951]|uniref:Uncharacterized protein n=1 Tax=Tilletiaria anomala (strain ATCC 24038 / CBS 436.72 / UBC 951) TaxID=1037660 RepID=A0A066WFP6_TILAU|nr:uncharacterized protein K437DRAFT_261232 [Tilletiaria anomala UBC 951]KDN52626.1 hypothetical protein K437DRAFT_261232 [Tilletiaria anomala UBC 951]